MSELPIKDIEGVAIIAREPAIGPHPKYGNSRVGPMEGVSKALLEDGSEVYLCDWPGCRFHAAAPVPIRSHRNATHRRSQPVQPLTDPATIRAVLRAVAAAKQVGGRDWSERAAAQLNKTEIKPYRNDTWTAAGVSRVYTKYKGKYIVRNRAVVNGSRPALARDAATDQLLEILVAVGHHIEEAVRLARALAVAPAVDPTILEKAARYDQLTAVLKPL
jgi:hypothetical protein